MHITEKANNTKRYETNYSTSVAFYSAILAPVVLVLIIIPIIKDFKNSWVALPIIVPGFILFEFLAIKYIRKEIDIDNIGITIKSSNYLQYTRWSNVVELKEYLFGQGELFYELITKDRKKIGFTSSIKHCDDLLREIECRTGLKFKQRL